MPRQRKRRSSSGGSGTAGGGLNSVPIIALLVVIIIGTIGLVVVEGPFRTALTTAQTDAETVTTGVAETTATITLPNAHWFADTTQLTATCATDTGSTVTAIDATRLVVTLGNLTASTVQVCTTTFLGENPDVDAIDFVELIPFFVVLAIVGASFTVGGQGIGSARSSGVFSGGGFGGLQVSNMMNLIVSIIVGVIMLPILITFILLVDVPYTNQPEVVGVTAMLVLITLGYVFALVGSAIGALTK